MNGKDDIDDDGKDKLKAFLPTSRLTSATTQNEQKIIPFSQVGFFQDFVPRPPNLSFTIFYPFKTPQAWTTSSVVGSYLGGPL